MERPKPQRAWAIGILAFLGALLISEGPSEAGPCLGLGRNVKWSPCPDRATSIDIASNNHRIGINNLFGDLVADDFRSDGRPVTDVHWWGSYIGNQVFPPQAFWIGFWSDLAGADPSRPNILLKSYVIPFAQAHEEFFGFQERFPETCEDIGGDPRCRGFQYFADISFDPFPDEEEGRCDTMQA